MRRHKKGNKMDQSIKDTEKLFFKDYFEFGSNRYEYGINVWEDVFKRNSDVFKKKIIFIEVYSLHAKALEDISAYLFGLLKAKSENKTLIETVVTYKLGESKISTLIKEKNNEEIAELFGINDIYKKLEKQLKKEYIQEFIYIFIKNIRLFAEEQDRCNHFYNKSKHGNVIVSSIKAIRPDSEADKDSVAVLSDSTTGAPNVIPFSDDQFFSLCRNTKILGDLIVEIIIAYCLGYRPRILDYLKIDLTKVK